MGTVFDRFVLLFLFVNTLGLYVVSTGFVVHKAGFLWKEKPYKKRYTRVTLIVLAFLMAGFLSFGSCWCASYPDNLDKTSIFLGYFVGLIFAVVTLFQVINFVYYCLSPESKESFRNRIKSFFLRLTEANPQP